MIVCGKCGEHNEDDAEFCSSCGEFLEWAGKRIEEPAGAVEVQQAAAPAEAGPEPTRGDTAPPTSVSDPEPASGVAAAEIATAGQEPAAPVEPGAGPPVSAPPDGRPPETAQELAARLPGEEFKRRAASKPVVEPDRGRAGDVYCTNCGTGNAASARFCRRCGTSLALAAAAHVPWWRRILPKRKPLAAGERPGRRRGQGTDLAGARRRGFPILKKVLIVVALVGAAVMILGPFRDAVVERPYAWAKEQFVDPVEIHPPRASGQSLAGHPARHAIDTSTATFWAPPGAPRQKTITVRLNEETDLRKVGFRLGSAGDFTRFSRPRVVRLRFFDSGGRLVRQRFERLRDTPDRQVYDLEANDVSRLQVMIVSVYPGQKRPQAAIAKIALWRRG